MIFRRNHRIKSFLSVVVLIWFVSFSIFLNASHHHHFKQYNYRNSTSHCRIEHHTNSIISDNALLSANSSVPNNSADSFSSICFVCLLLANLSFEGPLAPPVPILSDTETTYNIFKPILFVTSPDLSQNNPRSPPC